MIIRPVRDYYVPARTLWGRFFECGIMEGQENPLPNIDGFKLATTSTLSADLRCVVG
jgi:hypothetical protein